MDSNVLMKEHLYQKLNADIEKDTHNLLKDIESVSDVYFLD